MRPFSRRPDRLLRSSLLGAAVALTAAAKLASQSLPPRAPVATLSWGNGTIVLYAGVQTVEMAVLPAALLRQRQFADGELKFALTRDSAHAWTSSVRRHLDAKRPDAKASPADYGTALRGFSPGAQLIAGQDPAAPPFEPPFYLRVRSATDEAPVTFRLRKDELLRLLVVVDSLADAPPSDFGWNVALPFDQPRDLSLPSSDVETLEFGELKMPKGRRKPGEVLLFYVVDSTGAVDPSRIRVAYTDGEDLTRNAVTALVNSRFKPATIGGRPVAQFIDQRLSFFFRRRDD